MKKLLGILVLGLILTNISTSSFAYTISPAYWGKGPLKLSKNLADTLEYFFSSGKKGRWGKKQNNSGSHFLLLYLQMENIIKCGPIHGIDLIPTQIM